MLFKRSILVVATLVALTAFAMPVRAQFSGPLISICNDLATQDWDNFVVSMAGSPHTIDFSTMIALGSGFYGPRFDVGGGYEMEVFWTNAGAGGVTAGHTHLNTTGGNPGVYEAHHAQGLEQYQGYRITRTDGLSFDLNSLDYRNAAGPVSVGTFNFLTGSDITTNFMLIDATQGYMTSVPTWQTFNFIPVPVFADDLKLETIVAPSTPTAQCSTLTTSEAVTVTVKNTGINPVMAGTAFTLVFQIDANAFVSELVVIPTTITNQQTFTYTFTATADLSMPGPHTVTSTVAYPGDLDATNDQLVKMVTSPSPTVVSAFPFTENFDTFGATNGGTTPPPNWQQDPADGVTGMQGDWVFRNTQLAAGGPSADHSTGVSGQGFFSIVDDSGNQAAVGLLTSCLDLSGLVTPSLEFWVFSNNTAPTPATNQNFLHIDGLFYPGPVVIPDIVPPIGHLGSGWQLQLINLSAVGAQTVQLRFRASSNNSATTHSIAIDDIRVFDLVLGPGQAAQPGLAEFDVNAAADAQGLPVSFGANGPFFSSASAGDPLVFSFSGAPNQPFVLLAGPLNPAIAGFGAVGQLDLGNAIDPVTMLPTGVSIVGDGTQFSLLDFLFRTQGSGQQTIVFPMPNLPVGPFVAFQCIFFTGGPTVVAISNTVSLSIDP